MLLGHPDGGHGTGFVISRKHRLVATAAHVADHYIDHGRRMQAVLDGASTSYGIDKVWYHPGIVRQIGEGLYARSDNPNDGIVAYRVPDVAVLQLSKDGPELPAECELATDEEFGDLDGQEFGAIGFPAAVEERWPTEGRPAHAVFSIHSIDKTTNVMEQEGRPDLPKQWVWFRPNIGQGASGCPLILVNGHRLRNSKAGS